MGIWLEDNWAPGQRRNRLLWPTSVLPLCTGSGAKLEFLVQLGHCCCRTALVRLMQRVHPCSLPSARSRRVQMPRHFHGVALPPDPLLPFPFYSWTLLLRGPIFQVMLATEVALVIPAAGRLDAAQGAPFLGLHGLEGQGASLSTAVCLCLPLH